MKIHFLLAILASLGASAVAAPQAEQAPSPAAAPAAPVPLLVEIEHDDDIDDDEHLDFSRMLGDLLEFAEDDPDEADARESKALKDSKNYEKSLVTDRDVIDKYNNFVDAFFRRLSSSLKGRSDPFSISLSKKDNQKKVKDQEKPANKKKGDKKENKKENKRKGKKNDKAAKKNKKDKERSSRRPKSLDSLGDVDEETEVEEEDDEEEEQIETREKRDLAAVENDDDDDDDDDDALEEGSDREARGLDSDSESGKRKRVTSKKEKKKGGKKKKGSRKARKGSKKGGQKKGSKKGNKKNEKGEKKVKPENRAKRAVGQKRNRQSKAVISGFSLIQRHGDVKILDKGNSQIIKAEFRSGPILLRGSRSFGSGEKEVVRSAQAVAPVAEGRVEITVYKTGNAKVAKFHLKRPSDIRVEGSLAKDDRGKGKNKKGLENTLKKSSGLIAKKMLSAARSLLSETTSKKSNKNNDKKNKRSKN